jgi:hypothetical protein
MKRAIIGAMLLLIIGTGTRAQDNSGYDDKSIFSALRQRGVAVKALSSVKPLVAEQAKEARGVAVLSESRRKRQVSILHRVGTRFKLDWTSHDLPDEFGVSSPNEFVVFPMGLDEMVMFSGCARHLCGGKSGVGGILLYSTFRNQGFFARYSGTGSHDNAGVRVTFSKNALKSENQEYKEALQKEIDLLPYP